VIIAAFAQLSEAELEKFQPTLVYVGANNRISHTNRSIPKQMAAA
jgi:aspartate 1-decarboxylase